MSDSENPNTETGLSAESDYFDLVYNGDIVPDNDPEEVKARVAASFNLDTAAADQLFSGEPIRLKRGVDQFTAQRILKRLMDAGAAAKIVRVAKPEIIQKHPLALAPLGADVVDEAERARVHLRHCPIWTISVWNRLELILLSRLSCLRLKN